MSTNVIFGVRGKTGDPSSDSEVMVDTLETEVDADRANISREAGKSEAHFTVHMLNPQCCVRNKHRLCILLYIMTIKKMYDLHFLAKWASSLLLR